MGSSQPGRGMIAKKSRCPTFFFSSAVVAVPYVRAHCLRPRLREPWGRMDEKEIMSSGWGFILSQESLLQLMAGKLFSCQCFSAFMDASGPRALRMLVCHKTRSFSGVVFLVLWEAQWNANVKTQSLFPLCHLLDLYLLYSDFTLQISLSQGNVPESHHNYHITYQFLLQNVIFLKRLPFYPPAQDRH